MNFNKITLVKIPILILVYLSALSPAFGKLTVKGNKIFVTPDDALMAKVESLVDGTENHHYKNSKSILFLGEDFKPVNKKDNAKDLSETIQPIAKPSSTIFKTGIGHSGQGPYSTARGVMIVPKKVDHEKRFPFKSNSQNTIVGRRILCHCGKPIIPGHPHKTCGGIAVQPKGKGYHLFLNEVARTLDKNDPHAIAFLHGSHHAEYGRGAYGTHTEKQRRLEKISEQEIEKSIRDIVENFDGKLDIKMVYVQRPTQDVLKIRLDNLKKEAARTKDYSKVRSVSNLLKKYRQNPETSPPSTPVFYGVMMRPITEKAN